MTQDFEQFSKHWNRAVNGLVGRISTDSRAIYTRKDMDQMWREELLDHRFSSVGMVDEARAFMDDLYARRPATARALQNRLNSSRLGVGVEVEPCAVKGAAAVGSAVAAMALMDSGLNLAARVVTGVPVAAAAVALTGSVVTDLVSGAKQPLIDKIRNTAQLQLETYRDLLEKDAD